MTDREKVEKGMECCTSDVHDPYICQECPYLGHKPTRDGCIQPMLLEALALLKEQEARVLEYSEIEKHPLVWLEDNDKEDVIPALFLQYNGWNAEFSVQAPDKYVDSIIRSAKVIAVERVYGVTWRAWMAQPTEEQRKAVKWDD